MSSPMPALTPRPAASAVPGRATRPTLRLLHHMARSGGTLISKCLGCMSGVLLLSEIHPLGTNHFNPLVQAQRWYGLLSSQDLIELKARGRVGFADAIELIRRRAEECSQRLVIRDWSHLDFTGVPFVARPAHRLLTAEALAPRYELRQVCTVRHPLDQWLSLSQLAVVQGRLTLDGYLEGYRRFAEVAKAIGFHRYEDLTRDPQGVMKALCSESGAALRPQLRRALARVHLRHRRRRGQPRRPVRSSRCRVGQPRRTCWRDWRRTRTTAPASSCSDTSTPRTESVARRRRVPEQRDLSALARRAAPGNLTSGLRAADLPDRPIGLLDRPGVAGMVAERRARHVGAQVAPAVASSSGWLASRRAVRT